jgi:hypothetical protein
VSTTVATRAEASYTYSGYNPANLEEVIMSVRWTVLAAMALGVGTHFCTGCAPDPVASRLRTITVWGHGEVRTPPDRFELRIAVAHLDKDPGVARTRVAEGARNVLAVAAEFDLEEQETHTLDYTVDAEYTRKDHEFLGYEVEQRLKIVLTDVTKAEELTEAVLRAGVTDVRSVEFDTSQEETLFVRARAEALLDARTKARAMAAVLGQRVGLPLQIGQGGGGYDSDWGGDSLFGGGDEPPESSWATPHEVVVEAEIRVVFALHEE